MIGSSQDLNVIAQSGKTTKDELLTHHSGGMHGDIEPYGNDLPFGSVGKSSRTLPI